MSIGHPCESLEIGKGMRFRFFADLACVQVRNAEFLELEEGGRGRGILGICAGAERACARGKVSSFIPEGFLVRPPPEAFARNGVYFPSLRRFGNVLFNTHSKSPGLFSLPIV